MLLGANCFIFTNHENLPFANLNCCRILHWQLFVEEYGPAIIYHPGKNNVIVDTLSWLLHCVELPIPVRENAPVVLFDFMPKGLDINNNPDLLKCFLNLPLTNVTENNPVDLGWIYEQ